MKSSNLAQRLEEFEATLQSLQRTSGPATRHVELPGAAAAGEKRPRRMRRIRAIQLRDQGLRAFRVG